MLKAILVVWVVIVICLYLYYQYSMTGQATRSGQMPTLDKIVSATGADDQWFHLLAGMPATDQTTTLESLWLSGRPILFHGTLIHVRTLNEHFYRITLEHTDPKLRFDPPLQVSLMAEKQIVRTFLEAHPTVLSQQGLKNRITVVAQLEAIEAPGDGPYRDSNITVGVGHLLSLHYLPRLQ